MKLMRLFLPVLLAFATWTAAATYPALPDPLTTAKGVFKGAKIFNVTGDVIRIFHAGGITPVSPADLPPELAAALGFAPSAAPDKFPILPILFEVAGTTYVEPRIVAVEPDGIRIVHDAGSSKIPYQQLDGPLQTALGGFDERKAAAHRTQAQQAQADAIQAAQMKAETPPVNIAAANTELEKEAPNTVNPSIRLTAKTVAGGRSSDLTLYDTWGGFNKQTTTTRVIAVTVSSVARTPQQADIEVLFLWRDIQTKVMTITSTGRKKAVVVDGRPAMIACQDQAQSTHERNNELGTETRSGRRYVAWVARAVDSAGRVVAIYASVPAYEKYGHARLGSGLFGQ